MSDWPGVTGENRIPDDLQAGYGLPVIYSARVIDAVMNNLVCVGAVDVTWKAQMAMGQVMYIPVMDALTASQVDVSSDWGGITGANEAHVNRDMFATGVSITVDQWYECPIQVSDADMVQTQVKDLLPRMGKRAGYEIAKQIDTEVNGLFSTLTTASRGVDGQTFTDDLIIALMEGLDEADVPRSDRSLVVDPSCLADMYKIDKFVHKDYNQTLTGEIGRTPYGDTILITNNLTTSTGTGNYGALVHRDAIGAVIQMPPKIEAYRWAMRHSDVVNVSALFGADVLRATFGRVFYTRDSA